MSHTRCAKCGCRISEEDLKYRINVEMVADYGDSLSGLKEEVLEYMDRLLCQLEESEVLEREFYEEIYFILCKGCVDQFLRNPLGGKNRFASLTTGQSHLLH